MPLSTLQDAPALLPRLRAGGLSAEAAAGKAALLARSAAALRARGLPAKAAAHAFFVPGRVEILGKHTDYCGGRSLLAAVERGFCAVGVARADRRLIVTDAAAADLTDDDFSDDAFTATAFTDDGMDSAPRDPAGVTARLALDPDLVPPAGVWANYPATVARRLARNFGGGRARGAGGQRGAAREASDAGLRGADIAFASDLPPASGMSSSSALLICTYLLLDRVNRLSRRDEYRRAIHSPEDLAGYLATIENGQGFGPLAGDKGVGTFGGSEDHTALLCCRPGRLSLYAFCPARAEGSLALPAGHRLAIASSGVVAEKTGSAREKYNAASRLAAALVEGWNRHAGRHDPHLAAVLASAPDAAERMRRLIPTLAAPPVAPASAEELSRRFEHFVLENQCVIPAAVSLLRRLETDRAAGDGAGDLADLGRVVDESQRAAEQLLGNQVPQTVALARSAREAGAAAASAFGAGFGGGVWALVREDDAGAFLADWSARYAEAFPGPARRASFFTTPLGPAAFELVE